MGMQGAPNNSDVGMARWANGGWEKETGKPLAGWRLRHGFAAGAPTVASRLFPLVACLRL
jgi:hypothetical protein